tara:strand:- start:3 stop:242 length:240 start_codon:yes stop_codon:yes gene_type:complete
MVERNAAQDIIKTNVDKIPVKVVMLDNTQIKMPESVAKVVVLDVTVLVVRVLAIRIVKIVRYVDPVRTKMIMVKLDAYV